MRISDWSSDVGSSDLLYRASVEAMAQRAQVTLVPGATESECLRASRRMPDPQDRDAFARIVRVWQYAEYARRMPDEAEFDAMLVRKSTRRNSRQQGAYSMTSSA